MPARQYPQTFDMIQMLVCNKDPVQVTSCVPDGIETFFCLLAGDAGIEEQTHMFTARKNTVSAASAGQTANFHSLIIPFKDIDT
jgi:hypothetical protein